jgi:O-antigen/teichoic acid export membrane protein
MDDQLLTAAEPNNEPAADATRKHIRGSTLLLFGRLVMLGLNFGAQVLTVRYLAKSDFGAFSYALSLVAMAAVISLFGLDKAVARYVPIYHEQRDYPRMFGTILLTLVSIITLGVLVVAVVFLFQGYIGALLAADPMAVSLLLIVILIAPIQALESYFQDMLAVFANPRAIFFRRYVIGPALKLLAVLVVLFLKGNVYHLAIGYVIGSVFGLVLYAVIMLEVLRKQGLLEHFHLKTLVFPVKDLFGFSIPLLSTDFLNILKGSAVVLLLEYYRTSVDVAEYRAIVPVAGLNLMVMQSFKMLYTPMAARLYAHNDRQGINTLYWRTAVWIALFSFPVFVVTFSLAEPLTILLFGERYAQSGILLALLSFGNYFNAALGFNSYTLRVYGRVKFIVLIDVVTAVANIAINLILIPQFGALGAAIGTTVTMVLYNLLSHTGLLLGTGINLFQRRYILVYASILLASSGLLVFDLIFQSHIIISLILAGIVSLALLRINRVTLDVENMFPEIMRIPLMRPILGV